jgi:hypothetical protein
MVLQPNDPEQAQAWIRGTPPDQVVDFYIPRGNQGLPGPRGAQGPSLAVGSVVTTSDPLDGGVTPDQAKVTVTKTMDELDFEFYVPANQSQSKNFAIDMAMDL